MASSGLPELDMPVVGLNFTRIEANRNPIENLKGEINVNSTPKITEVKEAALQNVGQKALSLEFEFLTTYEPKIGSIKLEGGMLFVTDKHKEVLEKWGKDKALPDDASVEVLNHLFRRCLLKMANLAEDLQLPPPLQMPRVKAGD